MTDIYFQFDKQTGSHIRTFEGRKPVTFKKELNGVWDTLRSASDIYNHSELTLFSEYGVKKGSIIKPSLEYGEKYAAHVDDVDALTRSYPVVPMPNLTEKEDAKRIAWKDRIDVAAGEARKFFAPYELLDEEYSRTYQLTLDWTVDVIDNPNLIPPLVLSSWATASGMSVEDAAANILTTGEAYNQFMDAVRALRLLGKTSVANAAGIDIETVGQGVIDSIVALYVPPEEEEEEEIPV